MGQINLSQKAYLFSKDDLKATKFTKRAFYYKIFAIKSRTSKNFLSFKIIVIVLQLELEFVMFNQSSYFLTSIYWSDRGAMTISTNFEENELR
jgi:hypothetical protein